MLSDPTFTRLLALRTSLSRFEHACDAQARAVGLTGSQGQLLLAVRGHPDARGPTVSQVAEYLVIQHNSAIGLINRAEAAGLVERCRDPDDGRVVHVRLTPAGAGRLNALAPPHVDELRRLAAQFAGTWGGTPDTATPAAMTQVGDGPRAGALTVRVARVYDDADGDPAPRVLVDRLWPRGIARARAPFRAWARDLAPSSQLRVWYGHDPARFAEFARRYRTELRTTRALVGLVELRRRARAGELVLVTAARDVPHSAAAVLAEVVGAD
jgi:uncharacterized protein YeaO (DUF488 family)/DNA-binding MarR family transcriptional regulator